MDKLTGLVRGATPTRRVEPRLATSPPRRTRGSARGGRVRRPVRWAPHDVPSPRLLGRPNPALDQRSLHVGRRHGACPPRKSAPATHTRRRRRRSGRRLRASWAGRRRNEARRPDLPRSRLCPERRERCGSRKDQTSIFSTAPVPRAPPHHRDRTAGLSLIWSRTTSEAAAVRASQLAATSSGSFSRRR